ALEDTLGEPVRYFRPPHGARRPDVLRAARRLGLTPVMWNAMGYDWEASATRSRIEASLNRGINRNRRQHRGSNLLLHDGGQIAIGQNRSATVGAVASLIPKILDQGGHFVTVDTWAGS
ncbi:MAG TPA: polysaccharide deacetylase family protein, partial [Acidisarcina sp.]